MSETLEKQTWTEELEWMEWNNFDIDNKLEELWLTEQKEEVINKLDNIESNYGKDTKEFAVWYLKTHWDVEGFENINNFVDYLHEENFLQELLLVYQQDETKAIDLLADPSISWWFKEYLNHQNIEKCL